MTGNTPYTWNPQQVSQWASKIRLNQKYDSLIISQAIDGEVLLDSMRTIVDWREAGVKDPDDCRLLAGAVNALNFE